MCDELDTHIIIFYSIASNNFMIAQYLCWPNLLCHMSYPSYKLTILFVWGIYMEMTLHTQTLYIKLSYLMGWDEQIVQVDSDVTINICMHILFLHIVRPVISSFSDPLCNNSWPRLLLPWKSIMHYQNCNI